MTVGEATNGSLLLEVPVPFRMLDGEILMESQAQKGLIRWLENFNSVSICAPLKPEKQKSSSMSWAPLTDLLGTGRLRIELLPWAYHPLDHFREVGAVRRLFRELIPEHQYLCFSNLGSFGAWGRIAAEEAYKLGRPYAIWLDWVLHEMPVAREGNPLRRLWQMVNSAILKRTSLRDVKRAALGLFHGMSVYDAYAPYSRVPKLVHDIHLGQEDMITDKELEARFSRVRGTVSILYVGRVHQMKGPVLWVKCLERLIKSKDLGSVAVKATWVGEGPMLEELRGLVNQLGLSDVISFPGGEADRKEVLNRFRAADLFLFCHVTPESPRCLIEALMSGLPLLGFESAYANDLISQGGGETVPVGDVAALADMVAKYVSDTEARRSLSVAALRAGRLFSEELVFRHRADLIKEYL